MKDIRIQPAENPQGEIYARMLQLELEDAGYEASVGKVDARQPDFRLAILDADADSYADAEALCREGRIPFLSYREARAEDAALVRDGDGCFLRPIDIGVFLTACRLFFSGGEEGVAEKQGVLYLGSGPSDAAFRGKSLGLTPHEYALLSCLHAHRGQTLSREELYAVAWEKPVGAGESNVVDACVKNLRKKLDHRFGIRLIRSVRGEGYCLSSEGEEAWE